MGLLVLLAAACGGQNTDNTSNRAPTPIPPTPTLRSTPLPEVSPAPELGDAGRPVMLLFALRDTGPGIAAHERNLQDALDEALDVTITVEMGANENDAVAALCSGTPTVAWVSAYSYVLAYQDCGAVPVLAVRRQAAGETRETVGTSTAIVARAAIDDLSQLEGRVFCRSQERDETTRWVIPALLMAAQGVDPLVELDEVRDVPDDLALVRALYVGDCDAAALAPADLEDLAITLAGELSTDENPLIGSDIEESLHVISPAGTITAPASASSWRGYAANVVPYEVLVFPPDSALPTALRDEITAQVVEFFASGTQGERRLDDIFGASSIFEVEASDYTAFRTLMTDAQWDMAFLD